MEPRVCHKRISSARWLFAVVVLWIFSSGQTAASGSYPEAPAGDLDTIQAGYKALYINGVVIEGNKVTRDAIILRELPFNIPDTLDFTNLDSLLAVTRENIMNTSLFNFVEVDTTTREDPSGPVVVVIRVTERWYIWPIPFIRLGDRNFNVWWQTKDFSRLSYGINIDWRNFRGRRENLITTLQFGYDQVLGITYQVPYVNRKQTIGLGFSLGFARNHEVAYETYRNKQEFYHQEDGYSRKDFFAYGEFLVRKGIYNTHQLGLRYDHLQLSDSLVEKNPGYGPYGKDRFGFISLNYLYKSDHRDYKHYPLTGYYFDFEILKEGVPFIDGSGIDNLYVLSTFRKYWKISRRLFYASGLNCKFSPATTEPYILTRAIGYDRDIVRGYEYYVVDGQSFGILKNNLKFALLPPFMKEVGFLRSEKFRKTFFALYINLFVDVGYADNHQPDPSLENEMQNSMLTGFGAGIDFVTYYDIVVRFEYSFNRMMENGLFIHFRAPI